MKLLKRRNLVAILCVVVVASIFVAEAATAQADWPRWGGANADYTSGETFSTDWPADGLKQLWKAEIGTGFSSVSIVDEMLYTMGRKGGKKGEDVVYCLNANTGEEVWSYKYDAPIFDNLHEGGPGATPTVDGSRVYTLSRHGLLHCFDRKSGDILWEKNVSEMVGIKAPEWGLTASPLIIDDNVVIEAGRVIALNKVSGKEVWQTEKKYKPGYGMPTVTEQGGVKMIASLNNEVMQIVNASDGKTIATHPWKTQYATSAATPLVHENTFFISTGYGAGAILLKFADNKLSEVYRSKKLANHMNPSVLKDGLLFGVHGNSHNARNCRVVCMDYATGEEKWSHRGYGCGSLMIAGDQLLILSDDGQLVCAKASGDSYQELASAKILSGRCWTMPVLLNGKVFARNAKGSLVCVQLPQ